MNNIQSLREGTEAELEFISLRGDNIVRRATKQEDIYQHWDLLDLELGKVDVKAAKRKYRGGPIDYTIWWELKTVKRPPSYISSKGWGVPNDIDRLIAVRSSFGFHLINPSSIIDDINVRCTQYYRGDYGLHARPDRGDLMTILPLEYIIDNQTSFLEVLQ
jgi:hypothetical protein